MGLCPPPPLFLYSFKMFLYDLNPSNRHLSVLIIIHSGFNFIQFWSPLSEFSGSAPDSQTIFTPRSRTDKSQV